jgi:TPR repeat protein
MSASAVPLATTHAGRARWGWGVGAVAVLAAGAYLYATPYIALLQMKSAAERLAFVEMGEMVDRESLKQSLKDAIKTASATAKKDEAEAGLTKSGQSFADFAPLMGIGTDQILDKVLDPSSLKELESAAKAGSGVIGELVPAAEKEKAEQILADIKDKTSVSTGYSGLNSFDAVASNKYLGDVRLRLTRHGLVGWRLAEIDGGGAVLALMRRTGMAADEDALTDAAMKKKRWYIARQWAKVSAEQGNAIGHFHYAMLLLDGVAAKDRSVEEALKHLKAAVELKHADSAVLIARLYESGTAGKVNLDEAIKWYEKAFELHPRELHAARVAQLHVSDVQLSREKLSNALAWTKRAMDSSLYDPQLFASTNPKPYRSRRAHMHTSMNNALIRLSQGGQDSEIKLVSSISGSKASPAGIGPFVIGMALSDFEASFGTGFESTTRVNVSHTVSVSPMTERLTLHFRVPVAGGEMRLSSVQVQSTSRTPLAQTPAGVVVDAGSLGTPLASPEAPRRTRWGSCPLAEGDIVGDADEYGSWSGTAEVLRHGWLTTVRCVNGERLIHVGVQDASRQ